MAKNANASESESGEDTTTDDRLRKSLEKLKKSTAIKKSKDALQDQDTEGGLSSEGKPLSSKAKKSVKKSTPVKKRYSESDQSSPDDAAEDDENMSESQDESEDKPPMTKAKKSVKKSIRDRVEDDDYNLAKGMRVNEGLQEFVAATSDTIKDYQEEVVSRTRVIRKSLVEIGEAQTEDGQVLRKGLTLLAESQVALTEQLGDIQNTMRKLLKQPAVRSKSILSKAELPEEEQEEIDESEAQRTPQEESELVKSWLEEGVAKGKVNARYLAGYENHQQFNLLPDPIQRDIRKAITNGWKPTA